MSERSNSRTTPVSEQAAEWLVEFGNGKVDTGSRKRFLAWLRQSPEHIKEFLQLAALEIELTRNEGIGDTIGELVAMAKRDVVALDAGSDRQDVVAGKTPRAGRMQRWWPAVAATVTLAFAGLGWLWFTGQDGGESYVTGVGEQRSIALADGSMITLNTQSELRVRFVDDERRVNLLRGEALFDVAEDATRPFNVEAGPMTLTVVGTQFNVYRRSTQTVLTVVEGAVAVLAQSAATTTAAATERAVTATAGNRIAVAASGDIVKELEPDVSQATAWTERKLVFNDESLGEVIHEFNRYNRIQLVIDDPLLAQRTIRGVFNAHDTDVLTRFLANQPDLKIERTPEVIRITKKTP